MISNSGEKSPRNDIAVQLAGNQSKTTFKRIFLHNKTERLNTKNQDIISIEKRKRLIGLNLFLKKSLCNMRNDQ